MSTLSSEEKRCPTCGAQLDRFTGRLHCAACNKDVVLSSNPCNFRQAETFSSPDLAARNSYNNPRGIQVITDGAVGLDVATARRLRDWLNSVLPHADETRVLATNAPNSATETPAFPGLKSMSFRPDLPLVDFVMTFDSLESAQAARARISALVHGNAPSQKASDQSFAGTGPDDAEFGSAEWRRDNPDAENGRVGGG